MNTRICNVPTLSWANNRETDMVVAVAIHAIAKDERTADAIWEDPTADEWGRVLATVKDYIDAGLFPRQESYSWGQESFAWR